ncbi:MAG: hypothetical protein RLZZ306_1376 [Bacteroidota bacterium]|jgi:hypothetical protein
MEQYSVIVDIEALQDIQEATDWYNLQVKGLGSRFQKQVKFQIDSLKNDALIYTNRYSDVRCMLIKDFPFMVHYIVEESVPSIIVFAVIHTSKNPKIWEERNK